MHDLILSIKQKGIGEDQIAKVENVNDLNI